MNFLQDVLKKHFLFILGLVLLSYDYAWAYIDPSTGSYIIQIVIAGLLGAAFAVKSFGRNFLNFFRNKSSSDKKEEK